MSRTGANLVIGTAGHIDHGKTSLVRMLTGIDLDTQPEEQERGITIALGFTALELSDGRRAAFVDVPGHERLVRTMVAGATGVDAVLLCVSASDGVMPQTREHLAILEILGVQEGAVVLTMADLVDEELLELAEEDVRDLIVGTFLEKKPIIAVSSLTGVGREALIEAMSRFVVPGRSSRGPFRLPVDRAFVRPGFGTVVTGTVWSGSVSDGEQTTLLPGDKRARIRGLQAHGEPADSVEAGWRAALNLAGVECSEVPRGTVIATGAVATPLMIDVSYRHLPNIPPLPDGSSVRVLLGTAECIGRLWVADDYDEIRAGLQVYAQVRLDAPLPCMPGDRYVIRRTSPLETLGGGVVVDPWTPRMRHRRRMEWGKQIARLHRGDVAVWLERAGEEGLSPQEWRIRAGDSEVGEVLGERRFAATVVARLKGALLDALTRFHRGNPLSLGANRRELRRERLGHLPDKVFDALLERLASLGAVVIEGPLVRLAGFAVELTVEQSALQRRMAETIQRASLAGIKPKVLFEAHPESASTALLYLLEKAGSVQQVSGIGWVSSASLQRLERRVRDWFAEHEHLTPGNFKELTGLSRRAAIPLLEWLDRQRLTRRSGDQRVPGPLLAR